MVSDGELAEIKRKSVANVHESDSLRLNRTAQMAHHVYEESEEDEEEDDDRESRMEKMTTILAIVMGVIICIIIFVLLGKIFGLFTSNNPGNKIEHTQESSTGPIIDSNAEENKIVMISLDGWDVEKAKAKLIEMELIPRVTYKESGEYEAGIVMYANVSADEKLKPGSEVLLTVSSGIQGVEVPSTSGLTYEEAYILFHSEYDSDKNNPWKKHKP